jgi:Flp pilus assembly protein TadD
MRREARLAKPRREGLVPGTREGRAKLGSALLVVVVACIVYANSTGNRFVFDDRLLIEKNEVVQGEAGPGAILLSPYHGGSDGGGTGLYRPLTLASFALNYRAGGLDPRGYHWVNILLHAAVSLCVLALGARIGLDRRAALLGALLFATHPVHTEAVANLAGRAEILACLFALLALLAYSREGTKGIAWPASAGALFLLAMLAKENAVTVIAVFAGLDFLIARRRVGFLRRQGWLWAAVAVYLLLRFIALGAEFGGPAEVSYIDNPLVRAGLVERWSTALVIAARYIGLFLFPATLSPDYSYAQIVPVDSPLDPAVLLSGLVAGAVLLWFGWSLRRSRSIAFLLLFSIATFSIASNMIVLIGTIMAERLLYLPSVGMCLVAASAIPWVWRKAGRWPGILVAVLVLGAASVRTIDRNRDWRDGYTLFRSAALASPRSVKVRNNLGTELLKRGRPAEAKQEFQKAIEIAPDYPTARVNLAQCLLAEGDTEGAERAVRQVLAERPDNGAALLQLGEVLFRAGRLEEAERTFRRVLALDVDHANARERLGAVLLERGDPAGAEAELLEALRQAPDSVSAHNGLGLLYLDTGRVDRSVHHLREAVRLSPDSAPLRINLASALREERSFGEAMRELERARELSPGDSSVPYAIGLTLERADRLPEALEAYREIADSNPESLEAHRGLARVTLRMGRAEEAIGHADRAIGIRREDVEAHALRARSLFALRRYRDAEEEYRVVLRLNDRSVEARNSLGIIYALRGDRDAARAVWREALRLAPDSAEILDNLRRLDGAEP